MGRKKDKLIKEFLASPITAGNEGVVPETLFKDSYGDPSKTVNVTVLKVLPNGDLYVRRTSDLHGYKYDATVKPEQFTRSTFGVGANPFPDNSWRSKVDIKGFDLESILSRLDCPIRGAGEPTRYKVGGRIVPNVSFNPYVYAADGSKRYYQRPFCWKLKEKQSFIESIYLGINCGMILVRERTWEEVEREVSKGSEDVAFFDIVDGKQRAECLISFVKDGFKDMHGNYFSDLSGYAQVKFRNSMSVAYGAMKGITDQDTINAFLNVNYAGVPMSRDHIDYVRQIGKELSNNK